MFEYLLKYYIVNRYEFFRNSFEDENPARKTRVNERSERERRYLSYEQQLNLIIMDLITFIAWTYIRPNSKLPPASFPLLLLFPSSPRQSTCKNSGRLASSSIPRHQTGLF